MAEERSGWSRRGADIDTLPAGLDRRERVIAGRYRLEQALGTGGMGEVFRARDLELGEIVAIKLLRQVSPEAVELLRREVSFARRVTHEHVVRVHDFGIELDGSAYLTMEYVEGVTLHELRGTLAARAAAELACQICAGLDAAHRAGIVHGDLKPRNVLIRRTADGDHALLSDFGISRPIAQPSRDGRRAGTPGYMAPEQWSGGQVGPWSDLFALGVLLYELFAGERLLDASERLPTDLAARIRGRLPAPLIEIVLEMIEIDPARRAASVRRASRVLAELAGRARPDERDATTRIRLAVLPFRALGGAAQDHLGAGLADELVRVLNSNRGLAVMAVADPAVDPRSRGATAVVTGTVQRAGDRVRVGVELTDLATDQRLWGDRLDGTIADVFAFEDAMARRICEALRVGWLALLHVEPAPADALELYLRARRQLRHQVLLGPDGAVSLLDRVLVLAPRFAPAIALRAIACTRAWFVPSAGAERDWGATARAAVLLAREHAPALAETFVAAGMVAAQDGDYLASVRALDRALAIAPTSAEAHSYLGRLQAEAGRTEDGLWHIEQAGALDPKLQDYALYTVRYHALRGDRSRSEHLWSHQGFSRVMALTMLARIATWNRDRHELQRCLEALRQIPTHGGDAAIMVLFVRYVLGELDPAELDDYFERLVPRDRLSARVRSNAHQIMVEGHLARGALAHAQRHLVAAAELALIDLDWLEHCPLLAAIRGTPELVAATALVRKRAEAVWSA